MLVAKAVCVTTERAWLLPYHEIRVDCEKAAVISTPALSG